MRRLLGSLLVLHGFAHAAAGIWATPVGPTWFVTLLWWLAMVGFVAAGAGLIGVPKLDELWLPIATTAAAASILLIARYPTPATLVGSAIDGAVLLGAIPMVREIVLRDIGIPLHPPRRHLARLGTTIAVLVLCYASGLLLLRPWHMRWGVTRAELAMQLPGDELVSASGYRIDHGITIHAPADSVWPWLAQIGQDRGGFYSYSWLERLVGDPVHNADRIVPEWQSIQIGDLVRAAPPDYLGGVFGRDLGWRVREIVPRRALVLDGWGAFAVVPVDDSTSRLLVRTRGEGKLTLASVPLSAFSLLVFEPAHFIMERGMLRGIKHRAEARHSP
jgi:hypothetical protein